MDSTVFDINKMLQQMSPEEQQEALAALKISALSAMGSKGDAPSAPEPEEYILEEAEKLFGNQTRIATVYLERPLSIRGINILTPSQYMAYRDKIPPAEKTWWLLDPEQTSKGNCYHHYVNMDGQTVSTSEGFTNRGIRPVLILEKNSGLNIGSIFKIGDIPFRMISDRLAISDRTVFGETYRKCFIEKGLREWLEDNSKETATSIVHLGRYKWHSAGDPEPIEWQVLKQEEGRMLLISKYVLDYIVFDRKLQSYENSEVRTWLHESFFPEAFSEEEQKKILPGILSESRLEEDRVFLLNSKEAIKMLNKEERLGIYSPYVRKKYHLTAANPGLWWCRDALGPCPENYPYYVGKDGKTHYQYCSEETTKWNSRAKKCEPLPEPVYNIKPKGIRPCIWIRTE